MTPEVRERMGWDVQNGRERLAAVDPDAERSLRRARRAHRALFNARRTLRDGTQVPDNDAIARAVAMEYDVQGVNAPRDQRGSGNVTLILAGQVVLAEHQARFGHGQKADIVLQLPGNVA